MKISVPALVAGAFLLLAAQLFGQNSGTSHPEVLNDRIAVAAPQQPAPAPMLHERATVAAAPAPEVYGPYVPLAGSKPTQAIAVETATDPADAGIVTTFPYSATQLSEGTLLKARLNQKLSTQTTKAGTLFTALLSESVEHNGKIIFPVGSTLNGRVTSVRGGRRIGGAAAIHLEPESVTLPDGTSYQLSARVIDLSQYRNAKVNSEGTILRKDHAKATLTALSLTTGSAAAAGAMIAGGPGAAIGAGIGAGVGAIWWLKQDRQQTLAEGTQIVFSLVRPMGLTPGAE